MSVIPSARNHSSGCPIHSSTVVAPDANAEVLRRLHHAIKHLTAAEHRQNRSGRRTLLALPTRGSPTEDRVRDAAEDAAIGLRRAVRVVARGALWAIAVILGLTITAGVLRAEPKRIGEIYGVAIGVAVQVQPAGESDGVRLRGRTCESEPFRT